MSRQAQLADGTILEFPDETPDNVINNAVAQHIKSQAPDPRVAKANAAINNMMAFAGSIPGVSKVAPARALARAPMVPVTTKQQDIQALARQALQTNPPQAQNWFMTLGNRFANSGALGLGNMAEAAIAAPVNYAIDKIRGTGPGATMTLAEQYQRAKQYADAQSAANQTAHPIASGTGDVAGILAGGGLLSSGIKAGGNVIARVGVPGAEAVGNAIAASQELKKGQTLANLGKLTATGAGVSGGSTALQGGSPSEVLHSAEIGAVTAPLAYGGVNLAGLAAQKAAAVLNLGNAATILKRLTSATLPEIKAKLAEARANGVEPTLFELLPMKDRNAIAGHIVNSSDNALSATQKLAQARLANIGPEMAARVDAVTAPQRAAATQQMTDALTAARGTPTAPVPETPGDAALALRATRDPLAMASQPGREAAAIMAPHDTNELYPSLDNIMPTELNYVPAKTTTTPGQPTGLVDASGNPIIAPATSRTSSAFVEEVPSDKAVSSMIRTAAQNLRLKSAGDLGGGLTGSDISKLLEKLNTVANNPNRTDQSVAEAAVRHLEDMLAADHPEFAAANERMKAAYAARSRMAEGVTEGMNTRTAAEISPTGVTQPIKNAYQSPEGASGRAVGQANALQTGFAQAGPRAAVTQVAALPNDVAAITQNLGTEAAGQIADAAATQTEGARALAGLNAKTGSNASDFGPEELASAVLGLNPAAMIRTKIMSLHKIAQALNVAPEKANQLVELLFSTNPARRQQVLNMLSQTPAGQSALAGVAQAVALGTAAHVASQPAPPLANPAPTDQPAPDAAPTVDPTVDNSIPPEDPSALPDATAPAPAATSVEDMMKDPAVQQLLGGDTSPQASASPYASVVNRFVQTEPPEFMQLIHRQFGQESGNQQFDKSGRPKTSVKGAIGLAQVMPATAPQAARLAGLPFDAHAYRTDPSYNKAIGMAYMKAQLIHFNGSVAPALAAYNWGPDKVDRAIAKWGDAWLDHAPAETRNYVSSILG